MKKLTMVLLALFVMALISRYHEPKAVQGFNAEIKQDTPSFRITSKASKI